MTIQLDETVRAVELMWSLVTRHDPLMISVWRLLSSSGAGALQEIRLRVPVAQAFDYEGNECEEFIAHSQINSL